ncbi:ABC transporter permease [Loktanella fryxellensis]|uniref:ABC transporter permease n=1 Tax=Loktanella fryxellensis TaxID=245187 RepID=UPI001FDF72A4|nr:ABC transporter permease [Loktanella fryxellensis]
MVRDRAVTVMSLMALVVVWWGVAAWVATPRTFPGPAAVAAILWSEVTAGPLLAHLGATLTRVVAAFGLAMGLGAVLGVLLGTMPRVNRWIDPWLVVALNLPALIVIVLCYLWIGLNETAAITAVAFNKMATVAVALREGARTLDRPLADMARVYRLSWGARVRHVVLPQLAPYLAGAARNGLAIIWKLVLVVEFLGRPDGIGYQIHLYFQLFDVASVMAYALSFIIVMLTIEYGLLQRWEGHVTRWRMVVA